MSWRAGSQIVSILLSCKEIPIMDNIIQVTDFLQGRTYYMINDLPLEVIMCQTIARSYYLSYE